MCSCLGPSRKIIQVVPGKAFRLEGIQEHTEVPSKCESGRFRMSKWFSGQKDPKPPRDPAPWWYWFFDLPRACGCCVGREVQGNTDVQDGEERGEEDTVLLASGWGNHSLGQKSDLPGLLHRRNGGPCWTDCSLALISVPCASTH